MSQLVPRGPASLDRLEDYDAANMYSDWSRDDKRMLVSLDGLLTGVQTPTTHTLTPATTLSAIIDMEQNEESYHNEAGFVPPVISAQQASTYLNMVDTKSWQGGSATVTTMPPLPTLARSGVTTTSALSVNIPSGLPTSLPTAVVAPTPASATTPTRRNVGGRRPNKAKGISPEEEERRQVRRERNKAAAARCRKRRMDHTNALIKETEGLEHKKQGLQNEIQDLNEQLEELSYILQTHRATGTCRHTTGVTVPAPRPESPPDIKPVVVLPPEPLRIKQEVPPAATSNFVFEQPPPAKRPMLAMTTAAPISVPPPAPVSAMAPIATPTTSVSITKPLRPTSLPVPPHIILKTNATASEVAGIAISTPSTGIPFNFDSLMEGGTGLTPVSGPLVPSCSSQQRNHNSVDMASPDASIGNKLVSL